jgi:hypothetical protein
VRIPAAIDDFVDELAAMPGVVAVTLGGSRASGTVDERSDWDLGVYYRDARSLSLDALAARGTVYSPVSWGRIMNGGAWLEVGGAEVDVLLRDLEVVDQWSACASQGAFEVDALLGYLAGAPTYILLAERAVGLTLRGALPHAGGYPEALAELAPARWRFNSRFSLDYARMHAGRGDIAGAIGQAIKAALEEAHARMCERRAWVFNEKRLLERAGLGHVHTLVAGGPGKRLDGWLDDVGRTLDELGH